MIRKIIILGLIILIAFIFYKEFMAGTVEPFFKKKSKNIDLLGLKTSDYNVGE